MGILKVGVGAAQGVLADSWREYFYCDAMDVDVLAKKGEQRQSKRGFNTKKSENIISNGSIIVINEGQCMMIVEQGKVVEGCAEAGGGVSHCRRLLADCAHNSEGYENFA